MSIEEHELDNLNDEADVGAYDYEAPLTTPSSAPVWSAPTSSSTGYTYTPPASLAIPKAPAPPAAVKTAGFSSSSTTPRMPATPPSPKRPAAHAYNVPAVAGILHGDPDGIHGSASGFVTVGPCAAAVKTGYGLARPLIITGGWCYVWPCVQQCQLLDLRVMTLDVRSPSVYTKQGVPITVVSTAQVKISAEPDLLQISAGQFSGMTRLDVAKAIVETLEGHQRAIIGGMTVEEVFQDREKFSEEVEEHGAKDLAKMGIHIVSFTIRDISDDHNYLMSLGKKRTAEVMRDARIGEAEAERDASTRESEANLEKMSKTFDAETSIANSRRDFEMKKAAFDNEVNAEKAKAQMAGDLQKAKTRQEIKKEQMEVDVVGRKKQIEVDTHESKRKEKELEATIRKPALAERYRMEQQAEAERQAKITCADGSSKGAVSRGLAEASVIKSMGEAEAKSMALKADAYKQYSSGAYVEMYIKELPGMTRQVADAFSAKSEITFIATGSDDNIGASKVTGEIIEVLSSLTPMIQGFTGINVASSLTDMQAKKAATTTSSKSSSTSKTKVVSK